MQLAHLTADDEAPPPLSLYSFIALSYCFLASSAFFSHSYRQREGSGLVKRVRQERDSPVCVSAVKLHRIPLLMSCLIEAGLLQEVRTGRAETGVFVGFSSALQLHSCSVYGEKQLFARVGSG